MVFLVVEDIFRALSFLFCFLTTVGNAWTFRQPKISPRRHLQLFSLLFSPTISPLSSHLSPQVSREVPTESRQTSGLSWRLPRLSHLSLSSRRDWVLDRARFVSKLALAEEVTTLVTTLPLPVIPHALAADDPVDAQVSLARQCSDGTLMQESAIPGAYQQVCMTLPYRKINVQLSENVDEFKTLTIEQGSPGAGNTGMAVWNSSLLMNRLLERLTMLDRNWLSGKTVLDLGCGTGLASLTCALLGSKAVLATDGNPAVIELVQRNIRANGLNHIVSAAELKWGLLEAIDYADTADVVIGADLTYNSGSWPALADTISTVLKPENGIAIYLSVGHAGFPTTAEIEGFLTVCKSKGLVALAPEDKDWPFSSSQYRVPLSDLILRFAITSKERSIIEETGGVKALVLARKKRPSKR